MQLDPITFQATLKEEEFIAIQMQHSRRKRVYIYVLMAVLMTVLYLLPGTYGVTTFLMLQAMALVGGLLVFPLVLKRQWKKQFASYVALHKESTYTFSPEGIEIVTPNGINKSGWNEVYAAIALQDGMLFFLSSVNAYFLPKSAIAENWDAMLRYVELAPKCKRKLSGEWK